MMIAPLVVPMFEPATQRGVPDCFLAQPRPGQPVLVAVHGISRNASEIAARFAAAPAFRNVSIVAPLFDREQFGKYQQLLADRPNAIPADEGLLALLDTLEHSRGLDCRKVLLFGFSGGAQMAHRFAMLHPAKVNRLCIVSAGWYTLPTQDLPYPYGLERGPSQAPIGKEFLEIPTTVLVGNRDTRVDHSVSQCPRIVESQGRNRLRRAHVWVNAMQHAAISSGRKPNTSLVTMADVSHDFGQSAREGNLLGLVAEALL